MRMTIEALEGAVVFMHAFVGWDYHVALQYTRGLSTYWLGA